MKSPTLTAIAPWLPPPEPDLARLAMAAADAAGLRDLRAWPEWRHGGVGFGALPAFLPWRGQADGHLHLVLLQARELGALVPGARTTALPVDWLETLALADLARPLAAHPAFPEGTSVHVVRVPGPGLAQVRTAGAPAPELVRAVLARLTGWEAWEIVSEG